MSTNVLASLGLEFVNPYEVKLGLKRLKPSAEAQICAPIMSVPGVFESTLIKYKEHNFYDVLKKRIRCTGGSCCAKARDYMNFLDTLPDTDPRKRGRCSAQERVIFPVVLYQGKTIQAYGGPIEIRYMDLSLATYTKWVEKSASVNAEIAPFFERDFLLTYASATMKDAELSHLETRAKWLSDPAMSAQVMKELTDPGFLENYVRAVPVQMSEEDFLKAWSEGIVNAQQAQTAAEAATTMQPAINTMQMMNGYIPGQSPIPQPMQIQPQAVPISPIAQPIQMQSIPQPVQLQPQQLQAQQLQPQQPQLIVPQNPIPTVAQPVMETPQPVQVTPVLQSQPAVETPQTVQVTPVSQPIVQEVVPTTIAQPLEPTVAVTPEATVPTTETATAATPVTPAMTQQEISLSNVQDLDAIIKNLKQ